MKKIFIPIFICLCLIAYVVGYTTTTSTTNLELVKISEGDLIFDWFDTMNDNMDLIDAVFDTVTLAEFAFLDGVTSNIQDQLDAGGGGTYTAGTGLTLTGTVFSSKDSEIVHDNLSGFVANEHLDWTADQGETNIHAGNYTDTNTTYTGTANEITLTGTTFSLHSDIARDNELHTQNTDTDLDATFEATFFKKADSIGDIGDVDLTDIANGKILKYNSTSGNWECETETGGGASELSDLSDVGVTTKTDKFVLVADGDSFESRALLEADISDLGTYLEDITGEDLGDLANVGVDTATDKNALMGDGDSWESRALVEADISDLGDYATLTGDEVLTNKDINFVNALGSDHTYSGEVDSQPVGESVVFGQLLYYDWTDVEWKLAKANAFGTAKATRIALETKADGETCLMLVKGYIRDDSAFDFGASVIFLNDDIAGTCDDTAPAEAGDQIFVVGEAKSADILFFDPGKDVGEI